MGDIPQRPPGFQPRPDLLAQLNSAVQGVQVVTGMRGVGKTQLAGAYARAKLAEGWRLVAWVNAQDAGSLLAGLAAVADDWALADRSAGRDSRDPARMVQHQLVADGDRCLLVFDDVNDPDVLRPFTRDGAAAQVLITTTRQSVADLGTSVPVDVFSTDDALALLGERTGLEDGEGATALATELGHLPLALAQAAAVIAGQHLEYGVYLERLLALSIEEQLTREDGQPYPPGVAKAVLLALDAVRADDAAGVCTGVAEIMAVLSATGARRDLLHAAGQAGVLASGGHRLAAALVDWALARLADHSLVTVSLDGQTVTMHRLVVGMVREGLARQKRSTAVCRAAASVLEARAKALAESQDRQAVREITQQTTALADNTPKSAAEADGDLARALLRLRFWALYHLIELGDSSSQAIAVGEPLVADLEQVLGPDHPDTLNSRNSLAVAYRAAGRVAEAILLFEQTLVGREQVLGPEHPGTLNSQNNLAATYQDAGRVTEAILLFKLTLAARERLLGPDHPSTVNSRNNLAVAYRDAGRLAEAIPLLEQTLAVRDRLQGSGHRDTLRTRNNLANAYREVGRGAEAIPLIEQILAAREELLGADHPKTLASRNNLAIAYRDAGRAAEAIPLFEQNLDACERQLGADHPRTCRTRKNLALARKEVGPAE